jgi:hypothetical protein
MIKFEQLPEYGCQDDRERELAIATYVAAPWTFPLYEARILVAHFEDSEYRARARNMLMAKKVVK